MPHILRFRLQPVLLLTALALSALSPPAVASGRDDAETPVSAAASAPAAMARATSQPMVVVRMRGKDRCGTRCPEWIVAEGTVTPATPALFRRLLAGIGSARLPIVLDSRGGDVDAAMEIGRMIRARGLTTIIGRSEVQGCGPRQGSCLAPGLPYAGYVLPTGECAKACLLILAAGTQRVGYWVSEAQFLDADAAGRAGGYLADMGISAGLLPRLRRSGLPLDRAELLHFGFSTGRQRVEDFTGASICLRSVPAPNCMRLATTSPPARVSARPAARKPAARKPAAPRPARVIIWGGIEDM